MNSKKYKITALMQILFIILLILPILSACRVSEKSFELSQYAGRSIKTFQKKTGTKPVETTTGVYSLEGRLQLMAPKGEITSIMLLSEDKDFSLLGVKIGMGKAEAEPLLIKRYGNEVSKTIDSERNLLIFSYVDSNGEVYISYGVDTNSVVEMSYYIMAKTNTVDNNSTEAVNSGELIAMIGDVHVYYNEAMVYLKSVQENFESEYGKDIWKADIFGEGKAFGDHIKEEVLKQITELKIITEAARKAGIALTEEEMSEAKAYASEHYKGVSNDDIDRYLITKGLLERVYADNMLAEKMFETQTINVDTNVSELESKQITIQHIVIYGTEVNDEGKRVPLTQEKREAAYEKSNTLLQQAKETEDFYSMAETNSEDEIIEYTFGRGLGPEEYSDSFEQAAFTLKTGEVSELISTEYGWHIIYCVSDFNVDATTQVKEGIIEGRRTKMFSDLYTEWSAAYDVIVNNEAWEAVSIEN